MFQLTQLHNLESRSNSMKKSFLVTLLVALMVAAISMSAVAEGTLYSVKNAWYFDTDVAGTLTVKDNKKSFTYEGVQSHSM
jgi:hypothetical protein